MRKATKKTKKQTAKSKAKSSGMFSNFFADLAKTLSSTDLSIKVNNHEFTKDNKNNMRLSMTRDNIRTSIHLADSKLGIEQSSADDTK